MRDWMGRRRAKQTPGPEPRESSAPMPSADDLTWFAERVRFWQDWHRAHPPLSAEAMDQLEAARNRRTTRGQLDAIAQEVVMNNGWYVPPPGASGPTWDAVQRFVVEFQAANAVFEAQRSDFDWQQRARAEQPEYGWGHPGR